MHYIKSIFLIIIGSALIMKDLPLLLVGIFGLIAMKIDREHFEKII